MSNSKKRSNYEGSIRKRKDGRYEVRISVRHDFKTGGAKRFSFYTETEDEAVRKLHEMSFMNDTKPNSLKPITLGEWLNSSLEFYIRRGIKQSTYVSYEGIIRNHLIPHLGDVPLNELSPRLLQNFYNFIFDYEKLSAKTIQNINLFLHRSLEFAISEGYISSNPASYVNLPRGDRPQIRILSRDEQTRLIKASYSHRYGVFIRLTLFTGIRIGELLGLRWEDIDLQGNVLYIRRTLNRLPVIEQSKIQKGQKTEIVIQSPKTENSIRTIPLLPQIVSELLNWRDIQTADAAAAGTNYTVSGMLVTNPNGGYIEPRTFKDYYDQILDLAGLDHFTFHALRHTFASRALEQGVDPKTLSVLLGHASVSFTMDTYTHVLDRHKQESMMLLEELLSPTVPQPQSLTYPVIVTPSAQGVTSLIFPDFPFISCVTTNLTEGLSEMSDNLHESLLMCNEPPTPTSPAAFHLKPGQFVLQISAS